VKNRGGATTFDLNEISGRKDWPRQRHVENIFAIVSCRHHADGHTDAGAAGVVVTKIIRPPFRFAVEVVVGEIYGHLLSAGYARGDLYRKSGSGSIGLRPAAGRFFVEQGVAKRRFAVIAAKGEIGIEQQPALVFPWIVLPGILFQPFEIIARSGGKSEFCAHEILEDGSVVAADGPMRFVADDKLFVQEAIPRGKALDGCDHDLSLHPILPLLFVNNRADAAFAR